MEHQLTIAWDATTEHEPFDDHIRVMAEIPLASFEEGAPDSIGGKLLEMPDRLFERARSGNLLAELGGQPYRFRRLETDGTFELHRDFAASPPLDDAGKQLV